MASLASLCSFVSTLMVKLSSPLVVRFSTGRPVMEPNSSRRVDGLMSGLTTALDVIFECSGMLGPFLNRF